MSSVQRVLYWDSSAIISALMPGVDAEAQWWTANEDVHLISTLALAEVLSVLSRLARNKQIPAAVAATGREAAQKRWTRTSESPDWNVMVDLASRWSLRGADLWHLALARTLLREQPGLRLLSFDRRLAEAAAGEGLAATPRI